MNTIDIEIFLAKNAKNWPICTIEQKDKPFTYIRYNGYSLDKVDETKFTSDEWSPTQNLTDAFDLLENSNFSVYLGLSSSLEENYILHKKHDQAYYIEYLTPLGLVKGPLMETLPMAISHAVYEYLNTPEIKLIRGMLNS
jgi:hypothetical protein